jgi:hypothetical protein
MEDYKVEQIFATGIQVGVINLAKQLGILDDNLTDAQAYKIYTKKLVEEWRQKGWIVAYPSGNKERSKFIYKRSELETASRMLDLQNILPATKIDQIIETYRNDKITRKEQTSRNERKLSGTGSNTSQRIGKENPKSNKKEKAKMSVLA